MAVTARTTSQIIQISMFWMRSSALTVQTKTSIFGVPDYAMRLWLKPDRMAQLSLTATDVANAVTQQNKQFAIGRIGQPPTPYPVQQTFPVATTGPFTEPSQFENIILRASNEGAAIVRVKDVGYADLGRKDYSIRTIYQGKEATLIAVYQQPGANAIEVSKQVRATLTELSKSFPDGLKYDIALDTTKFVSASIHEVIHTFFEAVALVVFVVFIFLHSGRLTIIPTLAVPVSILGALIGMQIFGFSINMLTLFGMILAIGLVVDDAIVVVENTERNMVEYGLSPKEAAKRAMSEVTGPVIAIVLVLNAVFIPVAFLGGVTGQLYKQFAVTIAISIVFSGIVALTLSPALAALLIKTKQEQKHRFFKWFDTTFDRPSRLDLGRRTGDELCRQMGARNGVLPGRRRAGHDAANAGCRTHARAGANSRDRHAAAAGASHRNGERMCRCRWRGLISRRRPSRPPRSTKSAHKSRPRSPRPLRHRRPPKSASRRCRRPTTGRRRCPDPTATRPSTTSPRTPSICRTGSGSRRIPGSATRWTTRVSSKCGCAGRRRRTSTISRCARKFSTACAPFASTRSTTTRCTAAPACWRILTCSAPTASRTAACRSRTTRSSCTPILKGQVDRLVVVARLADLPPRVAYERRGRGERFAAND